MVSFNRPAVAPKVEIGAFGFAPPMLPAAPGVPVSVELLEDTLPGRPTEINVPVKSDTPLTRGLMKPSLILLAAKA